MIIDNMASSATPVVMGCNLLNSLATTFQPFYRGSRQQTLLRAARADAILDEHHKGMNPSILGNLLNNLITRDLQATPGNTMQSLMNTLYVLSAENSNHWTVRTIVEFVLQTLIRQILEVTENCSVAEGETSNMSSSSHRCCSTQVPENKFARPAANISAGRAGRPTPDPGLRRSVSR